MPQPGVPSGEDPVVAEVLQRLIEVHSPLRVYLFGSAARGDAGPGSDYDFMVLVPDDSPRSLLDPGLAYRATRTLRIAKDILVWPRGHFDKQLHLKASLPSTIVREGKLLYAA